MKKIAIALVASFLLIAGTAEAVSINQANAVAAVAAHRAAACDDSYWRCTEIRPILCEPTGVTLKGHDQWDCAVYVTRSSKNARERCHVAVGIGPFGGIIYGPQIHCFNYNAGDRR